jgi:alkylhydroperoxidase family enzyme
LSEHFSDKEIIELGFAISALQGCHRLSVMMGYEPVNSDGLTYMDLPGSKK